MNYFTKSVCRWTGTGSACVIVAILNHMCILSTLSVPSNNRDMKWPSSCKRDTKSKTHPGMKLALVGDMGVYGIVLFSCGISVILILTCGIAASSRSAVCGFSSFWLMLFGEIRLFTILRYRLFALSFRYNTQNKTKYDIKVNKS